MKSDPFVLLLISLYTYLIPVGVYVYILYVFDIIHQAWSKTINLIAEFKEEIVHKNVGSLQVHDIT